MLTKDDLKAIVDAISPLVDARAKTTDTLLKGEIQSVREEVAASEERVSTRIEETKEELRTEMLAARAEAKANIPTIDAKLVKKVNSHEKRIDDLEKRGRSPQPTQELI